MFQLLLKLLKHRVTWRFLLVCAVTIGLAVDTVGDLRSLEVFVCSLLTCSD